MIFKDSDPVLLVELDIQVENTVDVVQYFLCLQLSLTFILNLTVATISLPSHLC